MAFYLALMEVWRNRVRFFLFSLVIALITTLVLFVAALAEGLAQSNKEYLSKLNADLIVFQKNVDLSTTASRIGRSLLNDIQRVDGVAEIGSIGFSSATIVFSDGRKPLDVSLIGIDPGKPGAPPIVAGEDLLTNRGNDVVVDSNAVMDAGIAVGEEIRLKTIQGTEEQFYNLRVVGLTDGRKYLYQPSIFVPYLTWERIRPQASRGGSLVEYTTNVVAVRVKPGEDPKDIASRLESQVGDIDVVDPMTAIESIPGYSVQQNTLRTQQGFTLLIGLLVIGGFFQIQMLQKVPQIGVLKAIGATDAAVAGAVVLQIIIVTTFGVLLGSLVTIGLALGMPSGVPIVFSGNSVVTAILALLLIGPAGGLVTVRLAISVEPLRALGLSS
jgi:putative ABC transport system permease protein